MGNGSGPESGATSTGPVTSGGGNSATRAITRGPGGKVKRWTWDLGVADAETALAEARKALFVMVGFIALIWILQVINWADGYRLNSEFAIQAHSISKLGNIMTAPFLHVSWDHIESNSGPLFIFGFLAAYRGVTKFLCVTLLVILTSGFAAWFTQGGVGASGVVFGYFGYIMVRGFFDRHAIDMILGVVMALSFYYSFAVLLPTPGIGWQDHIGGLVGGIAAGWIFRDRRPKAAPGPRPSRGAASGTSTFTGGPRADLHKQLDDLGL
jgi:membrane associated rhomboid family serine protease